MQNLNMPTDVKRFHTDEEGSATVLGLFFFLSAAIIMGMALDQANGWRARTQMQIATDAAALAGAANLDDTVKARALAVQVANMNLPAEGQIELADVSFGYIDPVTFNFVEGTHDDGTVSAVSVDASRTTEGSNAVPTYLMQLIGMDTLNVRTDSVAAAQTNVGGGGNAGCEDAMFYSQSTVSVGGGYTMDGGVCVHGAGIDASGNEISGNYVHSGGNETLNPEVRLSATSMDAIYLGNSYSPSDMKPEEIMVERNMDATLLPRLDSMYDALWQALWTNDPERYSGDLLPSFLFEHDTATVSTEGEEVDEVVTGLPVVHVNGYWNAMTQDYGWNSPVLEENTIYVVNGNVGIASGVSVENVAIITNGSINVGGGGGTSFNNIFFFSKGNNGGSNAAVWGPSATDFCSRTDYTVHLFSLDGTVTAGNKMSGVIAAGKRINLGGGWTGSGVYFESEEGFQMGGGFTTTACDDVRQSDYELIDFSTETTTTTGSYLYR